MQVKVEVVKAFVKKINLMNIIKHCKNGGHSVFIVLFLSIALCVQAQKTLVSDANAPSVAQPKALDDAGSMCTAMIKYLIVETRCIASLPADSANLCPLIDNYINYILFKEYRCVGTGMGFDPAFYYHRPTHTSATHGYCPVIWAGAEMIHLLNKQHPKMNDSAIQYYITEPGSNEPIFSVTNEIAL